MAAQHIQQGPVGPGTNHEGYKDTTANAAISLAMNAKPKYSKGDIVTFVDRNGIDRPIVLLQCFDDFALALELKDEECEERDHKIRVKDIMHVDCGKVINVYFNRMNAVKMTMMDTAYKTLMDHVGRVLGVSPEPVVIEKEAPAEAPVEIVKEVPVYKDLPKELLDLPETIGNALKGQQAGNDNTELIRVQTERDLYKAMYMQLFDRLVGSKLAS